MKKAVVIFSGGQDSTTCLYWALKHFDSVSAITFDYGQNHKIEVEQSKGICDREQTEQIIINMNFLELIADSALISGGDVNITNAKGLPASFVPNRNALFITLAHAYAQKIGAQALVTGVCQTDYSGYPDCRAVFINEMELALNCGSDSEIEIITPLMFLNKAQTFKMADKLGKLHEVIVLSHTCYNGDRTMLHDWGYGCGTCPACELRKKGFREYLEIE